MQVLMKFLFKYFSKIILVEFHQAEKMTQFTLKLMLNKSKYDDNLF